MVYAFTFDAQGQEATVGLLIDEAIVRRPGVSLREFVRLEILDALENPDV